MAPQQHYWLVKSEPSTYSYTDLKRDGKTAWNGVRNYQARNFLREITKGDLLLIYHSGEDKAVVGIAKAISLPYLEEVPKEESGDWVQVDLVPHLEFKKRVGLQQLKMAPDFKDLLLIKQSRLSVMPVTKSQFEEICRLGGVQWRNRQESNL